MNIYYYALRRHRPDNKAENITSYAVDQIWKTTKYDVKGWHPNHEHERYIHFTPIDLYTYDMLLAFGVTDEGYPWPIRPKTHGNNRVRNSFVKWSKK